MYSGTPVLVAGGAGYIGSQTCKALAQAGYLPVVLDNLVTGHAEAVRWGPLHKGDIRDEGLVAAIVRQYGICGAIHFAAFSQVGESVRDPARYYDNNVAAAVRFADALIGADVKALVFSSTAAVYGAPQVSLIPEDHPLQPINPYGASKLAFEQALGWLDGSHGLKSVVLRYFNAAGADPDGETGELHEPETHLIPLICGAALGQGPALTIFGQDYDTRDGTPIRDYVHVTDLARAHVLAIERLLQGGDSLTANLGAGAGSTVMEIMAAAEAVMGRPAPHRFGPRRAGDPVSLVADTRRAREELGWAPVRSDLHTIITDAWAWARATQASVLELS